MIVRIASEGQYDLADEHHDELNRLDDATVEAVDAGDRAGFRNAFDALLTFVRDHGTPVGDDDLRGSDIILPPPDLSFEEAGSDFNGEGLVPDPPTSGATA